MTVKKKTVIRKNRLARRRVQATAGGELVTKQSHKDECDINVIIRRHLDYGVELPEAVEAQFLDTTGMDFQESMNANRELQEAFMDLPADFRLSLGNDPGNYLDWLQENNEKIASSGLRAALIEELAPEEPQRDYGKHRRKEQQALESAENAQNAPNSAENSPQAETTI